MVDTDDTQRMTDDKRRTTRVRHKLPSDELKIKYYWCYYSKIRKYFTFLAVKKIQINFTSK